MKNKNLRSNQIWRVMGFLLALAVVIIGNGQSSVQAQEPDQRKAKTTHEWSIISNTLNPYDEVGLKHNQILVAFFKSDDFHSFNEYRI